MDHRRTPSGKAYVPASWFIVLTILLVVGAAGWLGWLFVDDDPDTPAANPSASTSAPPTTTPAPSPSATTETTPSPTPTKKTEPTDEPEVRREAPVSVLNNTTIQGLAATYSAKVRAAGWLNVTIGNWRGSIAGNTVYFPPQLADQATLLGKDLGISRILPAIAPMRTDRLTIILSGPQQ
jgi:hypothetical protein